MTKKQINYASNWFQLQSIKIEIKGLEIYLIVDKHFTFRLSDEEINYRALSFLQSEIDSIENE